MNIKISKLKEIREKQGVTISQLSRESGVATRTITRIEKCEGNPKIETLNKVLNTLNDLSREKYTFNQVFEE